MPRDGSGIYHRPAGTDAVPDTTIESSKYNNFTTDVETDLNAPRPVVAGGTGAANVVDALANLNGEMEGQTVVNYDSQVWLAGSFYSASGATSAPVAGHRFTGIVYMLDSNNIFLQARDLDDMMQPGRMWVRERKAGTWSNWNMREGAFISAAATVPVNPVHGEFWWQTDTAALMIYYDNGTTKQWVPAAPAAADLSVYLLKSGGTMTGLLTLSADPSTNLQAATKQYADAKVAKGGDIMTGLLTLSADPSTALQAATKQYVDAARTNPVTRFHLGGLTLSTAGSSTTFSVNTGAASDSTNADMMTLASAMSKTTASWAVGTAQGALDTGAIAASTWYHVYLIKRPDTGVVDIAISLNATGTLGATVPAAYTLKRRIGAILTNATSQWTLFHQLGDEFLWDVPVGDVSVVNLSTTATLYALTVPLGVQVGALMRITVGSAAIANIIVHSPDEAVQVPNTPVGNTTASNINTGLTVRFQPPAIRTNTSQQIRAVSDAAGTILRVATYGYTDRRGRDQ